MKPSTHTPAALAHRWTHDGRDEDSLGHFERWQTRFQVSRAHGHLCRERPVPVEQTMRNQSLCRSLLGSTLLGCTSAAILPLEPRGRGQLPFCSAPWLELAPHMSWSACHHSGDLGRPSVSTVPLKEHAWLVNLLEAAAPPDQGAGEPSLGQQLLKTRGLENRHSVSRDWLRGCKVRWLTVLFFNSSVLDLLSRGTWQSRASMVYVVI